MVVGDDDDVRPGLRLDGRRDAGLDVVLVDPLDLDLHAGLLAELGRLLVEEDVRRLDEVRPLEQVEPGAPRRGRGLGVGEDAGEAAGRHRGAGRRDRAAQPGAPGDVSVGSSARRSIVARHGWPSSRGGRCRSGRTPGSAGPATVASHSATEPPPGESRGSRPVRAPRELGRGQPEPRADSQGIVEVDPVQPGQGLRRDPMAGGDGRERVPPADDDLAGDAGAGAAAAVATATALGPATAGTTNSRIPRSRPPGRWLSSLRRWVVTRYSRAISASDWLRPIRCTTHVGRLDGGGGLERGVEPGHRRRAATGACSSRRAA